VLLAGLLASPALVSADAPEWLRTAARVRLPQYDAETYAVLVHNERIISVKDNGDVKSVLRRAFRILRPEGRDLGHVRIPFDRETKVAYLKAWSLPAQGKEYELKESDTAEVALYDDLYSDAKEKAFTIPAAEPGNTIGYEVEQKGRPSILQDRWRFSSPFPVVLSRLVLQLPEGWEYQAVWINHAEQEPRALGPTTWSWELQNLPAVEIQPEMPPFSAVAASLAVSYFPRRGDVASRGMGTWHDVGKWYAQLASGRRQTTPAIQQKVAELTAGKTSTLEKMQALAGFAQRDIRYVSIQIGIGGLQPHLASDVFTNRYGDCKDKATLLSTMLKEIGIDSYYVAIHTERGFTARDFPSVVNFNHVILAIKVPESVPLVNLYPVYDHKQLGKLLFFDPTDRITPLGNLPSTLQASYGLLVTENGGELIELPLQAPSTNRLLRTGKLSLAPNGTLSGDILEVRWGSFATDRRYSFLARAGTDRKKVVEDFLSGFLTGFTLTAAHLENLENYDQNLIMRYSFIAERYAKTAGNMLLLRPRIVGQKSTTLLEGKERKYPVEFPEASVQTDQFEITLPTGFKLEEIPPPTEVDAGFAEYRSRIQVEGNVLKYSREYKVKQVLVGMSRLEDLKKFYRQVAADERFNAVLQRIQ
jgi:hypothetical protein